jgi:hypothetical protein
MMAQYLEGLPGLSSLEDPRLLNSSGPQFEAQLLAFYEQFLKVTEAELPVLHSPFGLGEQTGQTFRRFIERLKEVKAAPRALKGQVIGPFTLLCGLKDQNGRALIYDERYQDIVPKLLGLKARWQIEIMGQFKVPVIIFLDEPGLAGFGSSALISVSAELVVRLISEVTEAIHAAGGLAGIHVCANTDWQLAFNSNLDILNFDSYGYFDKFALYEKQYLDFIGRGANVAWGVIPTSEPDLLANLTAQSLVSTWRGQVEKLAAAGGLSLRQIVSHSLFTPGCGCGSLTEAQAARVIELLEGFCEIIGKEDQ